MEGVYLESIRDIRVCEIGLWRTALGEISRFGIGDTLSWS